MPNWNATINATDPEKFIGVVVEKDGTIATCTGTGSHIKGDGTTIPILEWDIVSKVTGETKKRWTKTKFVFADLPIFFKGEKKQWYEEKELGTP